MPQRTAVVEPPGLTTNQAPYIQEAQHNGQLYIHQPYELYSKEDHEAWRRLFARMLPRWDRYGNEHFLKGIRSLCLDPERVPKLDEVNRFLKPLTGFQARPVSGYIPAFLFFDCLRNRTFPTDHDPPFRQARLSSRTRHFSRRGRSCADAHRSCLCRNSGSIRRVRAYRGGAGVGHS